MPTRHGFTLVELVLVMGIIATLAMVAAPRFGHGTPGRRLDAGQKRLLADLEYAGQLARARSQSVSITFDNVGETYTISNAVDPLKRDPAGYTVTLSDSPYKLDLGTIDLNGDNVLIYDGFGAPDSGGTIQFTSGGSSRTVTLPDP